MMQLVFLGTGGSTPTKERGMPAIALQRDGDVFLFDCGEGTQMQAMKFDVNIAKIAAIFITHTHGDHVIGIAGLVRTLALNKRPKPLEIFVPAGEEKKITTLLTFDKALIGYPVIVKGISSGVIYKGKDFTISAFRLNHRVPTVGYVFRENDRRHFDKEKCMRLGLKGTMFRDLIAKGSITVNGKRVSLSSVSTQERGKSIVYAGDTRPVASTVNAAKGADVLIHESSFADMHKSLAKERLHSTAGEAAKIAKKAGCKSLFLIHLSARYKNHEQLLKDAKSVFKNAQIARDGMRVEV